MLHSSPPAPGCAEWIDLHRRAQHPPQSIEPSSITIRCPTLTQTIHYSLSFFIPRLDCEIQRVMPRASSRVLKTEFLRSFTKLSLLLGKCWFTFITNGIRFKKMFFLVFWIGHFVWMFLDWCRLRYWWWQRD